MLRPLRLRMLNLEPDVPSRVHAACAAENFVEAHLLMLCRECVDEQEAVALADALRRQKLSGSDVEEVPLEISFDAGLTGLSAVPAEPRHMRRQRASSGS